jgi:hypothetical protein
LRRGLHSFAASRLPDFAASRFRFVASGFRFVRDINGGITLDSTYRRGRIERDSGSQRRGSDTTRDISGGGESKATASWEISAVGIEGNVHSNVSF